MNAYDPKWNQLVISEDFVKQDTPEKMVVNNENLIEIHPEDGKPIIFRWHFPRNTLSKRMSGFELAMVLGPHFGALIPYLTEHKRACEELTAMFTYIYTRPRILSDRVLPWMKPVVRTDEYDIIELSLFAQGEQIAPKSYFV